MIRKVCNILSTVLIVLMLLNVFLFPSLLERRQC